MDTIGKRLRIMREAHNLSRPKMSLALKDICVTTYKNHELEYRSTSAETIRAVAETFGLQWAGFVLGVAEQPPVVKSLVNHS